MKNKMILFIAILLVVLLTLTPLVTAYLIHEKIGRNFTPEEQQELIRDIKNIRARVHLN